MKVKFEANGRTVTISASMDTLSDIAIMALDSKDKRIKNGHPYAAEIYADWFNGIHNALDAKDYYDDVKEK